MRLFNHMCFVSKLGLLAPLVLTGCQGSETQEPRQAIAASLPAPTKATLPKRVSPTVSSPLPTTPVPCPNDASTIEALTELSVQDAWVLSPRSLLLKLRFENGTMAAWKPLLRKNKRALNEVASYRLSRLLGVCEVPAAARRALPLRSTVSLVSQRNREAGAALVRKTAADDSGAVQGAIISWIDDLDDTGLSARGGRAFLSRILEQSGQGTHSGDEALLAAQYSRMLVFDYVSGNWDRFSGGNLYQSRDGKRLVLLDHNNAFAPWSARQKERMQSQLDLLTRFDRRQIEALRGLTAQRLAQAMGDDELLCDEALRLTTLRAEHVLRRVSQQAATGANPYLP
ncbi:MAG: hypothetical protein MUC50_23780 [Myxococcota bacterium]|nr:hypothetical protein [Myxococcota bacterium]